MLLVSESDRTRKLKIITNSQSIANANQSTNVKRKYAYLINLIKQAISVVIFSINYGCNISAKTLSGKTSIGKISS